MSFLQILAVHRLSLKLLPVPLVCFLLCWLGLHELQAQQIVIRRGGKNADLELYKQFSNLLDGKRTAAKNRIESQLLDIDRVCELLPKQRTRLEIAGKGAVISYSNKVVEKLEQLAKGSGFEFNRGKPPEEDPDDEEDDGENNRRQLRAINLGEGPNGELKVTVDTEQIWVASLKKTLTKAQAEKLESWTITREKIIRQAAVDHLIAKANLKMFLSREQSQKLEAYVDQEYGPQLVQQLKTPSKQNRKFFIPGVLRLNRDIEVDDSLKEFLSKPQLEIWKTDFQGNLDSLEGG